MISLHNTEAITATVLFFFAYVISITLSANFQAYIAKWMGDDTAESIGLTEFNPFLFIDVLSLVWFALLNVMIGRPVPIQLRNIKRSWWPLRVFLAFGSRTMFCLFFATIASVTVLSLCGPMAQLIIGSTSLQQMSLLLPHLSSNWLIFCLFCNTLVHANLVLTVFSSVRQAVYFFVMYKLEKDYSFMAHADYLLMFGPLLIWFFFGRLIFTTFYYILGCLVFGMTKVCGVA